MKIIDQIELLKPQLEKLISTDATKIEKFKDNIQKLVEASSDFGNNWIGSWASRNYNLYNNFASDDGGTVQIDEEQIQSFIEKKSGITLKAIKDEVPDFMKSNREYRDEVVTELSVIKRNKSLASENELLEEIENQEWGISPHDYVKMNRPNSVYTHNPAQILNKGLDTPPHINIDSELMSLFTMVASVEDFHKNVKRLLRQLELKDTGSDDNELETVSNSAFVYKLIDKFHTVANQLRNRHSNKDTILISNEYDVQDLLHGLLKIEFEDVRAEEYTPSYAGSSTRVDFLLKKEK